MDLSFRSSMGSSPLNHWTLGAGSPKIGTSNFILSVAEAVMSLAPFSSMYGSTEINFFEETVIKNINFNVNFYRDNPL